MVAEYGIKYAVHIITTHFGGLVAKVCECLLRKGPLSLPNITRYTELSPKQVKNILLVLIQHNCVQSFILEQPGGFGDGPKVITHYMPLIDNILHRMRFSKFLRVVSEELDKECEELLEGLLQHGRLSVQQMLDRAKDTKKQESPPEDATAKKKGAKSAKGKTEEPKSLEQRVLAAAVPMEAKRFSTALITESDVGGRAPGMTIGEKRKPDALENVTWKPDALENVTWRANYEECIRRLRHKACIENVASQLDNDAAVVLKAMIDASRSEENKIKAENSGPLSMSSIYEEVIKSESGRNMTLDRVRTHLIQLGTPPFVRAVDESYIIDFNCIIEQAQKEEVESIVLKRYGNDAYSMFRLLLANNGGLLETKKISDATFVEKENAQKILYKLWKGDYLHMEKLEFKLANLLLWKVNKRTLWEHVLDEMFHAALNLSRRLAYELEQEKEVLSLPADRRAGPLKDRYERIRRVRLLLESAQMKLDDGIMLFHHF
ncbi:DNA-directed RNA polymerase III subunit RPC3-like isoform X1 [Tripterygium wilfordii]|uniref:DNA-directed RNA polymerase III subunit RPC3 n=1 Tax=Tripterygium wilfordii TaxID=458696 RepID=A0A7J7CE10_TRIWF|nr:DNA-directed RNA polymerase III subunit RPC3-like isoform X1 [Tripterygium wilfordii]